MVKDRPEIIAKVCHEWRWSINGERTLHFGNSERTVANTGLLNQFFQVQVQPIPPARGQEVRVCYYKQELDIK